MRAHVYPTSFTTRGSEVDSQQWDLRRVDFRRRQHIRACIIPRETRSIQELCAVAVQILVRWIPGIGAFPVCMGFRDNRSSG